MVGNLIMTVKGSKILSNSWKQRLDVSDKGVEGEMLILGKRKIGFIPYTKIAAVVVENKIFSATLEIINTGGIGNIVVKGLKKDYARQVKEFLETKLVEV